MAASYSVCRFGIASPGFGSRDVALETSRSGFALGVKDYRLIIRPRFAFPTVQHVSTLWDTSWCCTLPALKSIVLLDVRIDEPTMHATGPRGKVGK